ncbi:unnamed protein product [Dibothriocephalus latus]|uniref:UTP--glucose-1-phosphate uridylyltransferase n=1 Tax=Dibothriocephalus latus TaxID=60516 RepID=A0A3P7LI99_DIBLA|nr:unnamed protein product [Dibothriocephalus latus]
MRPKDPVPKQEKSGVVCRLQCSCGICTYVGEIGRQLKTRMHDHQLAPRRLDPKLEIAAYAAEMGHDFKFDVVEIVDRSDDHTSRKIKEAWMSTDRSFREVKQSDADNGLQEVFMGMRLAVPESERQEALIDEDTFFSLYRSLLDEKRESIDWSLIKQPEESVMSNYEDFPKPKEADMVDALSKLVVIKLNGGLGTSMGCCGPKSLIKVRDDCTFLDLTVQQIEVGKLNSAYNAGVLF